MSIVLDSLSKQPRRVKKLSWPKKAPTRTENALKLPNMTVETKQNIDEEVCISYAKQC